MSSTRQSFLGDTVRDFTDESPARVYIARVFLTAEEKRAPAERSAMKKSPKRTNFTTARVTSSPEPNVPETLFRSRDLEAGDVSVAGTDRFSARAPAADAALPREAHEPLKG